MVYREGTRTYQAFRKAGRAPRNPRNFRSSPRTMLPLGSPTWTLSVGWGAEGQSHCTSLMLSLKLYLKWKSWSVRICKPPDIRLWLFFRQDLRKGVYCWCFLAPFRPGFWAPYGTPFPATGALLPRKKQGFFKSMQILSFKINLENLYLKYGFVQIRRLRIFWTSRFLVFGAAREHQTLKLKLKRTLLNKNKGSAFMRQTCFLWNMALSGTLKPDKNVKPQKRWA